MPGYGDYTAESVLNWITGQIPMPALPSVWLALFTVAPTADAGTGGTECSGNGYARVQVAGNIAAGGAISTGSSTITMSEDNPGWVVAGMSVYSTTAGQHIGTVSTYPTNSTTLTLTGNAAHNGSGSSDNLTFSAWPAASASSGTEPAVTPATLTNGAIVTFPAATGGGSGFGTVIFFGLYDASSSGDYLLGDYLGSYAWLPATMTSASPGIITAHAHGYSLGDPVVVTAKYGGTIPSFSQSNLTGVLAVAATVTTDTFTVTNASTAVNTSSSGDFSIRKIVQQSIPSGVTASFAASTIPIYSA